MRFARSCENAGGLSTIVTEADVTGIDNEKFQTVAETTKKNCPVSRALASVGNITLNAKLISA